MLTSALSRAAAPGAVLMLVAAACGGGGGPKPDVDDPTGAPGGTFATALAEPTSLAPASNCYESECAAVLKMINDPLVSIDLQSGQLVYNGLAKSIQPSPDQTVWTITLKSGRTFHNGEPVNADAFIRSWNYAQDETNAQAAAGFLARIKGAGGGEEEMSGLTKVDDLTFQVVLDGPFSQFGQQLSYAPAFAPIAKACLDDLAACNAEPIGTGPYRMEGEWRHDEGITVTKWGDYRGDQPANADTIEFTMFSTPRDAYLDFQNGGIDVVTVAPDIYLEVKGALGDELLEEPTASVTYLGLPIRQAPYDNRQLRQALSLAIDRAQVVDRVLNGLAQPASDVVPPFIPGWRDGACQYCTYDPERAKALLEASGVDPGSFTLEVYVNAGTGNEQWMEAVARQIEANLDIDYELKPIESAQYLNLRDAQEFTGPFPLEWSPDYPSLEGYLRPLLSSGGALNYTGYASPRLARLLVNGDQATSFAGSFASYQQAGNVALEDMPMMPMWSELTAIASSDRVSNVRFDLGEGEIAFGEITVVE